MFSLLSSSSSSWKAAIDMGIIPSVEWTESTWNPITGCDKISPGCKHCYAERMARRLKAMGQPNYVNGFDLAFHEHTLQRAISKSRGLSIFVISANPQKSLSSSSNGVA
jgi:protein gp37